MSDATKQKPKRTEKGKSRWHHARWGLIGLIIVLVVAILAFFGVNRPVGLRDSLKTTVVPEFSQTMKPVAGWKTTFSNPASSTSYYNGSTNTNRVIYVKKNIDVDNKQTQSTGSTFYGNCYVTYQTIFLPQYLAGAGDDFLSQSYIYSQEGSYNSLPTKQQTVTIAASDGRSVAFRTAYYKSGKTAAAGAASDYDGYFAVRGVDKTYTTKEKAADAQYGTKTNKVVPVLTVSYTCANGGKIDPALWPKFLAAATVLVK